MGIFRAEELSRNREDSRRAFTLVEIMIVVLIIGLLAAIAVPTLLRASSSSKASRFANDIRKLSEATKMYLITYGEYPGDGLPGTTPNYNLSYGGTGQPFVSDEVWTAENALGGEWDFEGPGTFFGANRVGISSRNHNATEETLQMIDDRIDDGSLSSGLFRMVGANRVFLIVDS